MTDKQRQIKVICYAGHKAEEEPRSFFLGKREIIVKAILDRWLSPEHRYFKIRGEDDAIYILRYDVVNDFWEFIMFDKGNIEDTRLSST